MAVSALAIIDAAHRRTDKARLARVLSGTRVVPVGDGEAKAASATLVNAGPHGHTCAIDAAVAEMASRQRRPVAMLTSDTGDMARLCGDRVRSVAVQPVRARTSQGPAACAGRSSGELRHPGTAARGEE